MQRRESRWMAFGLALGLGVISIGSGLAQTPDDAASGSALATLGLPEVEIVITDTALVVSGEVEAGPIYVTLDNQTDTYTDAQFIGLPDGMPVETLSSMPDDGTTPDWFYDVTFAGGLSAEGGQQEDVVVNLAPGTWWVQSLESGLPPVEVTVTGEAVDAASAGVEADLQVETGPYVFNFPDEIASGPQIWEVTNTHEVPHHVVIVSYPEPVTIEQVEATLEFEATGTPVPGMLDFSLVQDAAYVTVLSQGQTLWDDIDLAPGHYIALCFVADEGQMVPHAAMGMIDIFTVR